MTVTYEVNIIEYRDGREHAEILTLRGALDIVRAALPMIDRALLTADFTPDDEASHEDLGSAPMPTPTPQFADASPVKRTRRTKAQIAADKAAEAAAAMHGALAPGEVTGVEPPQPGQQLHNNNAPGVPNDPAAPVLDDSGAVVPPPTPVAPTAAGSGYNPFAPPAA